MERLHPGRRPDHLALGHVRLPAPDTSGLPQSLRARSRAAAAATERRRGRCSRRQRRRRIVGRCCRRAIMAPVPFFTAFLCLHCVTSACLLPSPLLVGLVEGVHNSSASCPPPPPSSFFHLCLKCTAVAQNKHARLLLAKKKQNRRDENCQ